MTEAPALRDLSSHWLPFTPIRDFETSPKLFARAAGVHYFTPQGRPVLDGVSGLFTSPAGHCRAEIAEAVYRQLTELDYCASFQRSHPRAFEAAARIAALTPDGLDHVFFCNSGSEAVETAMKIALAYHRARGDSGRSLFVSRERAYHGVGLGGVALSGMANNRRAFGYGLPPVAHMRHTHRPGSQGDAGHDLADDLARIVQVHGAESIAACFVEPIAGSTGVLVPPEGYLQRLRALCDAHGILLVFDEVITGFGRTGHAFAAQAFGVTPDLMTMAKAITNGAQPMAAVAASHEIYRTVVTDSAADPSACEFFHGYTSSAHPAACAAAIAAMDIYARDELFTRSSELSEYFLPALFSLRDVGVVTDVRGYGLMGGIDLDPSATAGARGHTLQKQLFDLGLHVKTTGDCAITAPAFVMSPAQIDEMMDILRKALRAF